MKNKNHQLHFHQYIDQIARHRLSVVIVTSLMFVGVLSLDMRARSAMQYVYWEGLDWISHHLRHEHPSHMHGSYAYARIPTISGPGPS